MRAAGSGMRGAAVAAAWALRQATAALPCSDWPPPYGTRQQVAPSVRRRSCRLLPLLQRLPLVLLVSLPPRRPSCRARGDLPAGG